MSDSDEQVCPLCCEELDISDQNFLPCKCGYQVRFGVRPPEQLARPKTFGRPCARAPRPARASVAPARPGPGSRAAGAARGRAATPSTRPRERRDGETETHDAQTTHANAGLHVVLAPHQGELE